MTKVFQDFLKICVNRNQRPLITVHANLEEILENLGHQISLRPGQLFRVGTGEHSDSLALDPYLRISPHLIRFFSNLPNAVLELKTKSDHVDHLLDLSHGGKTVIAWSLNPEIVIEQEEHKTAVLCSSCSMTISGFSDHAITVLPP